MYVFYHINCATCSIYRTKTVAEEFSFWKLHHRFRGREDLWFPFSTVSFPSSILNFVWKVTNSHVLVYLFDSLVAIPQETPATIVTLHAVEKTSGSQAAIHIPTPISHTHQATPISHTHQATPISHTHHEFGGNLVLRLPDQLRALHGEGGEPYDGQEPGINLL